MSARRGPVLIEEAAGGPAPSPAAAAPVPDTVAEAPTGQAMRTMAALAARRGSALGRWFWRLLGALAVFTLGVLAWGAVDRLIAASPLLGWAALVLLGAFVCVCLAIAVRELSALARLSRLDHVHKAAAAALVADDLVGGARCRSTGCWPSMPGARRCPGAATA